MAANFSGASTQTTVLVPKTNSALHGVSKTRAGGAYGHDPPAFCECIIPPPPSETPKSYPLAPNPLKPRHIDFHRERSEKEAIRERACSTPCLFGLSCTTTVSSAFHKLEKTRFFFARAFDARRRLLNFFVWAGQYIYS